MDKSFDKGLGAFYIPDPVLYTFSRSILSPYFKGRVCPLNTVFLCIIRKEGVFRTSSHTSVNPARKLILLGVGQRGGIPLLPTYPPYFFKNTGLFNTKKEKVRSGNTRENITSQ
jgi:hypothetical protein